MLQWLLIRAYRNIRHRYARYMPRSMGFITHATRHLSRKVERWLVVTDLFPQKEHPISATMGFNRF